MMGDITRLVTGFAGASWVATACATVLLWRDGKELSAPIICAVASGLLYAGLTAGARAINAPSPPGSKGAP